MTKIKRDVALLGLAVNFSLFHKPETNSQEVATNCPIIFRDV